MTKLPPMNLGPESAAWGRAIQELIVKGNNTQRQQGTQLIANNQQTTYALRANKNTNFALAEAGISIATAQQPPATPVAVGATSTGSWSATGSAVTTVQVTWIAGGSEGFADVGHYEVWWKLAASVEAEYVRLSATTVSPFEFTGLAGGLDITVRVRAISTQGVSGEFGVEGTVTTVAPANTLLAPSVPSLSSSIGSLTVNWDGKLNNAALAPVQVAYAKAYISTTSGGTYFLAGSTILAGGGMVIAGEVPGTTRWVKLQLTDTLGRTSPMSAAASVVIAGSGLPYAMASGNQSLTVPAGANVAAVTISFPLDRFTVPPNVVVTLSNASTGSQKLIPRNYNVSAASVTLAVYTGDWPTAVSAAHTSTLAWTAVQMAPGSANG